MFHCVDFAYYFLFGFCILIFVWMKAFWNILKKQLYVILLTSAFFPWILQYNHVEASRIALLEGSWLFFCRHFSRLFIFVKKLWPVKTYDKWVNKLFGQYDTFAMRYCHISPFIGRPFDFYLLTYLFRKWCLLIERMKRNVG